MRKIILFNCLVAILSISNLAGQKVQSLLEQSIAVKSIDPSDEDFSDLQPLAEKIGTSRIVVLGEISHTDGSSLAAKSRLVKFLHQKMGFDVLAWEAGILDCWQLNHELHSMTPLDEAKLNLMLGGWDSEEQVQPVFEYAKKTWNSNSPLEMMGFDMSRPKFGYRNFINLLNAFIKEKPFLQLTNEIMKAIDTVAKINYGYANWSEKLDSLIPVEIQIKAENGLKSILSIFKANEKILSTSISKKNLDFYQFNVEMFLDHWAALKFAYKYNFEEWNRCRDSLMAKSFLYQMEHLYKDRKIIVWAATAHFIREQQKIEAVEATNVPASPKYLWKRKQAGGYIYSAIGKELYTIAFTSHHGTTGLVYSDFDSRKPRSIIDTIPMPLAESFETIAHTAGKPFLIADLRNAPAGHWLGGKFISYCLGFNGNKTVWKDAIDALFFIDEMYPVRKLPRGK